MRVCPAIHVRPVSGTTLLSMKRPRPGKRTNQFQLALAYLGAWTPSNVRLQGVIDRHIARVLAAADGNLSLAAELLGIHRRSLQRIQRRKRGARSKHR